MSSRMSVIQGAEPELRVAVVRCHVEVIDPTIHGLTHRPVRNLLRDVTERRRAKDQDRTVMPQTSGRRCSTVPNLWR